MGRNGDAGGARGSGTAAAAAVDLEHGRDQGVGVVVRGVHSPLPRRIHAQQRFAQHEPLCVRDCVATAGPALKEQRVAQ